MRRIGDGRRLVDGEPVLLHEGGKMRRRKGFQRDLRRIRRIGNRRAWIGNLGSPAAALDRPAGSTELLRKEKLTKGKDCWWTTSGGEKPEKVVEGVKFPIK